MPDVRTTLVPAWRRTAAPGARPPRRADWVLVAVLAVAAVGEGAIRANLAWPLTSTLVTVAMLCVLPWRRTHPLAAVAGGTIAGSALEVAQHTAGHETDGMFTQAAFILLPYALYRWGSGRAVVAGTALLVVGAAVSVATGWSGPADAIGGAVVLALAMSVGEAVRQRAAARSRLVEAARARERERLARDLHDTVAHHVAAIAVRAQAGQVAPARAVEALGVIEAEARRALAEMRSVVGALRDDGTPDRLPAPGLDDLAALASAADRPAVIVHTDPVTLDEQTATALYRAAQEAVANARRHARGATRIDVTVHADGDQVHLRVHDDGASPSPPTPGGFGLVGMAERAAALGGTRAAGPDPSGGWTVRMTVPVGRARLPQ